MAQSVYLMGATYQDVPSVVLPTDNQGGTASFYDARTVTYNLSGGATVSANPPNAIAGQGFTVKLKAPAGYVLSNVSVTMGGVDITSQVFTPETGGGGGSVTVTEEANATGITCVITTGSEPTPPEPTPGDIPLNTELVDYTKVMTGYAINGSGVIENTGQSWDAISDYIPIDPSMTFTFKTLKWYNVGFYDSSKNVVRVVTGGDIETSSSSDISTGTLNASNIPSTAAYIILSGNAYSLQGSMSLIRTA